MSVSILKNVHFAKQKLNTYKHVSLKFESMASISVETINNIWKMFLSINKNRTLLDLLLEANAPKGLEIMTID